MNTISKGLVRKSLRMRKIVKYGAERKTYAVGKLAVSIKLPVATELCLIIGLELPGVIRNFLASLGVVLVRFILVIVVLRLGFHSQVRIPLQTVNVPVSLDVK